jgi:hypothetical protein
MSNPETTKPLTNYDYQQTLKKAYNETNATLGVDGFVVAQVGNTIIVTYPSNTTEIYSFYENTSTLIYTIQITYTDSTKANVSQIARTS